jgi:uncharacterized lipoprotein YddW (UPF0748 family)
MKHQIAVIFGLLALLGASKAAAAVTKPAPAEQTTAAPAALSPYGTGVTGFMASAPKREVRAVWLTAIGGLDWPRHKANSPAGIAAQKEELRQILDKLHAARFNTVMLQTRVRSTVIYPSAIEPWDDCLTGHAAKAPGYDPLQFAIEECHRRGMQLHAWVVAFPGNSLRLARNLGRQALQRRVPRLCLKTDDFWMLNPGEPETAAYLAGICKEIVSHYDVDGIHLDYIRYPEKEVHYNDAATYRKYGRGQNLASWRRNNVTRCVRAIHQAIKAEKPWVRLSCSSVGKFDDVDRYSSRGWNAYSKVHQDAQGWLHEGIMDMLVPMMYFLGDNFYPFALDWKEQSAGRIIVPGLGAYLLRDRNWQLGDIERENAFLRTISADGQAYFRSSFITDNTKGIYNYLSRQFYTSPALAPALTWERATPPAAPTAPRMTATANGYRLSWNGSNEDGTTYNIYRSSTYPVDTEDADHLIDCGIRETTYDIALPVPEGMLPYYAVRAMDRYGNESQAVAVNCPTPLRQSQVTGLLRLSGERVTFDRVEGAQYLMVTDQTERVVHVAPFDTTFKARSLAPGIYTIRTLGKKAKHHTLGKLIWH